MEGQYKWSGKEAIQNNAEMIDRVWDFLNKVLGADRAEKSSSEDTVEVSR